MNADVVIVAINIAIIVVDITIVGWATAGNPLIHLASHGACIGIWVGTTATKVLGLAHVHQ